MTALFYKRGMLLIKSYLYTPKNMFHNLKKHIFEAQDMNLTKETAVEILQSK